jgi:tetratricopeptide (TPR) repeat protein
MGNGMQAESLFHQGKGLFSEKKYEEALVAYDKGIELNPKNFEAWWAKGTLLYMLARYEEALIAYDKAIELDPQKKDTWYGKEMVLSKLGRHEEALVTIDKAIELNPQNAYAWRNKGEALSNLGRYEEALNAYDKAIVLDPNNIKASNIKRNILVKRGMEEETLAPIKTENPPLGTKNNSSNTYENWSTHTNFIYIIIGYGLFFLGWIFINAKINKKFMGINYPPVLLFFAILLCAAGTALLIFSIGRKMFKTWVPPHDEEVEVPSGSHLERRTDIDWNLPGASPNQYKRVVDSYTKKVVHVDGKFDHHFKFRWQWWKERLWILVIVLVPIIIYTIWLSVVYKGPLFDL